MDFRAVTRPWDRRSGQHAIKGRPVGALVRAAGRVVLWVLIAVVLVRGAGAILAGPQSASHQAGRDTRSAGFPDAEARAFAVSFTHAYLNYTGGGKDQRVLAGFFGEGLGDHAIPEVSRRSPGARVAWATVAREQALGASRALITVAPIYRDGTGRYLTVPVARDEAGGLSVFDLPAFVAPPPHGRAGAAELVPLVGSEAGAITDLAERFLTRYLTGAAKGELSYFVEPGIGIAPMPGGLRVIGVESVQGAAEDDDRGQKRTIVARVRVRDEAAGTTHVLSYRLVVVRRERWYVRSVEGAPA